MSVPSEQMILDQAGAAINALTGTASAAAQAGKRNAQEIRQAAQEFKVTAKEANEALMRAGQLSAEEKARDSATYDEYTSQHLKYEQNLKQVGQDINQLYADMRANQAFMASPTPSFFDDPLGAITHPARVKEARKRVQLAATRLVERDMIRTQMQGAANALKQHLDASAPAAVEQAIIDAQVKGQLVDAQGKVLGATEAAATAERAGFEAQMTAYKSQLDSALLPLEVKGRLLSIADTALNIEMKRFEFDNELKRRETMKPLAEMFKTDVASLLATVSNQEEMGWLYKAALNMAPPPTNADELDRVGKFMPAFAQTMPGMPAMLEITQEWLKTKGEIDANGKFSPSALAMANAEGQLTEFGQQLNNTAALQLRALGSVEQFPKFLNSDIGRKASISNPAMQKLNALVTSGQLQGGITGDALLGLGTPNEVWDLVSDLQNYIYGVSGLRQIGVQGELGPMLTVNMPGKFFSGWESPAPIASVEVLNTALARKERARQQRAISDALKVAPEESPMGLRGRQ